ncbi:MAG: hypothetical protein E6R05_00415 [Candidatus Moraniibacteriota bacterium]|nr:MAG: hypothetical protein E6R05_00415 [Candidatus Moranbacteria bacterium]
MKKIKVVGVEDISIVELMGMGEVEKESIVDFLAEFNATVWESFFLTRLPLLLTKEQLQSISELVETQENIDNIIDNIETFVPSIKQLLFEYTIQYKLEYVENYYREKTAEYRLIHEQMLKDKKTDRRSLEKIIKSRDKYESALNYTIQKKWKELLALNG